jgi:deoxyadenosine/deoxycytidine kinase
MTEIENTNTIIRKIRDNFYEDTKEMTLEKRTNYINKRYENSCEHWTSRNTLHTENKRNS